MVLEFEAEKRRAEKKSKKQNCSIKGGHVTPIIIPSTHRGGVPDMLKRAVKDESELNKDMKFKIVELGGRKVKSLLQRSNPTASARCTDEACITCR